MLNAIFDILTDKLFVGFILFIIIWYMIRDKSIETDDFKILNIFKLCLTYIAATAVVNYIYDSKLDEASNVSVRSDDI